MDIKRISFHDIEPMFRMTMGWQNACELSSLRVLLCCFVSQSKTQSCSSMQSFTSNCENALRCKQHKSSWSNEVLNHFWGSFISTLEQAQRPTDVLFACESDVDLSRRPYSTLLLHALFGFAAYHATHSWLGQSPADQIDANAAGQVQLSSTRGEALCLQKAWSILKHTGTPWNLNSYVLHYV